MRHSKLFIRLLGILTLVFLFAGTSHAQGNEELAYAIDNLFVFVCAVLVLFMQAGFSMLEAGLNDAKNTVNILFKNIMDLCLGLCIFWLFGYGLMYPGVEFAGGLFGFGGFGISEATPVPGSGVLNPQVDFLFQAAFAATAATIVSGAVAGRLRISAYLIYSAVITGFIYPISGMWKWGGGWLDSLGFHDFAGSILVHGVGGFAGLAAAIVLGPRIGRFGKDSEKRPMNGHSMALTALGVLILWIGWYGFNPGSQLAISGAANTDAVVHIAVNTSMAAAAGALIAFFISWYTLKKHNLTYALNGALAGLVGITANCDSVTNLEAMFIGGVAGGLVIFGMKLLERFKIDDPVGAWPVHGLCGVWGGIAAGIFGGHPLSAQIIGSVVVPLWGFSTMLGLFYALKVVGNLRVSKEHEELGLDLAEHGIEAYGGLALFSIRR